MIVSMILAACQPSAPATTVVEEPTEAPAAARPTDVPVAEEKPTEVPAAAEKVQIRWFVGLGTGTSPEQIATQEEVVADFNASQDAIELVLEVVPYDTARDTLSTQMLLAAALTSSARWAGVARTPSTDNGWTSAPTLKKPGLTPPSSTRPS
jgi:multiple sugar transport system substrate-binding protein